MSSKIRYKKGQLTSKLVNTANNVLSGQYKSLKAAMIAGGYSPSSAAHPGQAFLSRPGLKKYLRILDKKSKELYGVKLIDKLADVYMEGLEAVKVDRGGKQVKDFSTRLAYADRVAEFLDLVQKWQPMGGYPGQANQINVFPMDEDGKKKFNEAFGQFVSNLYQKS